MRKILLLILAAILTLSVAGIAVASNILNAEYKTVIAVTNNSSAATNVAVPFTLSTFEMVDVGMLSVNASDAVMISGGGSDAAFMPSSDNSSPWITWVSSIGTDSQVLQFLYSKGASSGKIRYFPDDAGMSANDSASLELGDNFTIEQKGWIDTSGETSSNLISKPAAFRSYVSASENITSGIVSGYNWITPTANGTSTGWANPENAYDDNVTSCASDSIGNGASSEWFTLNHSGVFGDRSRYYIDSIDSTPTGITMQVEAYYNSAWNAVYSNGWTDDTWTTKTYSDGYVSVTSIRFKFTNNSGGTRNVGIKEVDFGEDTFAASVTATGISSGEHTLKTQYTPNLLINSSFETGDPPDDWILAGAGGQVFSQCSTENYAGSYSGNLTRNGNDCRIYLNVATVVGGIDELKDKEVTFGAAVKTDAANKCKLSFYDGNTYVAASSYHTGSGNWTWLAISYNVTDAATMMRANFMVENSGNTTGFIDAAIVIIGNSVSDYNSLRIFVDGVEKDQAYTEVAVTDNSENLTYYQNMGGYWEYTKVWCGDTLQQHIEWEYNAVEFTDLSGNDHSVAPTFRTTSSNANVSAEVSQQEGLVTSSTPSSNVSGGWTMITSALETPENLFSEGGDTYAVGEFNVGELVTDYAADAGHPPEPYHFLLAFGLALIVILGVYGFTHGSRAGRQGSLSLAFFAGGLVLIAFYRFETIPGWTLIPYGLGAIVLIMWRRTPSPVD